MSDKLIILFLLSGLLSGMHGSMCSEARQTLAVADSLRVNEGRLYDDSIAIALAYETFCSRRLIYPNDYARACYYYGYLLRQHNDHVAAMRAFIKGSHAPYVGRVVHLPWFTDYHILGRIYSNMGTMCHLVDEFELSYDMYEQSAKAFQKSGDTTAYYYALNAMALQLAEQKLHNETLALLEDIGQECTDVGVLAKIWETRAILYYNLEQYDSTVYSVKQLQSHGNHESTGYVKIAQAYWELQQYDSALYYAQKAVTLTDVSNQDTYNMLYLIYNHDTTLTIRDVQDFSAQRADLYHEHIDPMRQKLSRATEILLQDLNKKPYYINIGLLLLSCCIILGLWRIAMVKTKRNRMRTIAEIETRHSEIRQDIAIQREHLHYETEREQQKQSELLLRNRQLEVQNDLLQTEHDAHREKLISEIESNCAAINHSKDWKTELHWKDYDAFCETADRYFFLLAGKLTTGYNLDEKEVRLCILELLNQFSNKQLAQHLNYSASGIGTYKYRLSQKLNTHSKDLRDFLLELAVSGALSSPKKENVQANKRTIH